MFSYGFQVCFLRKTDDHVVAAGIGPEVLRRLAGLAQKMISPVDHIPKTINMEIPSGNFGLFISKMKWYIFHCKDSLAQMWSVIKLRVAFVTDGKKLTEIESAVRVHLFLFHCSHFTSEVYIYPVF